MKHLRIAFGATVLLALAAIAAGIDSLPPARAADAGNPATAAPNHLRATYSPLHFKPAILAASDAQCLECHREVLADGVRAASPAGVKAADAKAWYQRLATYAGEQESFHRRHLTTPLAKQLMDLKCNTCHEGHDPREEAQASSASAPAQDDHGFTLRKQVNPETTCLKCHGQMPAKEIMGLPGPWPEVKDMFQNNCLLCHAAIRTERHQVSYLKAKEIEELATAQGADVCYGCHGGRAWYRVAFPYARHAWPNMPPDTPAWAKKRPTRSEARFEPSASLNSNAKPTP